MNRMEHIPCDTMCFWQERHDWTWERNATRTQPRTVPRWVSFRISIGSGNKTVPRRWNEAASLSDSEKTKPLWRKYTKYNCATELLESISTWIFCSSQVNKHLLIALQTQQLPYFFQSVFFFLTSNFEAMNRRTKTANFQLPLKKISVMPRGGQSCSDFNRRLGPEGQDITISPRVPSPVSRRGMNVSRCRFQNSPWVALRRSLSKHWYV